MAQPSERPLSPHLSVYRITITMAMSILHRIVGVGLYLGAALLAWWLVAAATGGEALELVHAVFGHWLGQLVLFGYTWALFHHLVGGLRYLVWDTGRGMGHPARELMAWGTLAGGLALTLGAWALLVWF